MVAKIERKAFDKPDEARPFKDGKGKVEVVTLGDHTNAEAHSNPDGSGRNTLSRLLERRHAKRRTPATFSKGTWS